MTPEPAEDRLGDLLLRWDELRRQGQIASAEDLCATSPELVDELRRRIVAVREMDCVLDFEPAQTHAIADGERLEGSSKERGLPDVLSAVAVYRPERHHARGGLGEVLTARQEELNRTVALKRIRPEKLHEAARQRFLREAAITARLQHPGIVPIYGLGQDDDGPFYTMPFIAGQTLQEAIDAFHGDESLRRDPGQRALRFRGLLQQFITVCNTIAYTHDQGVIHRDLKPSNIMLGPYGETLVMDWGLAKRLGAVGASGEAEGEAPSSSPSLDALTATGDVMGTPHYMSPEQAKGQPVGPASDIFSLGLVLYAILTGKSAFDEQSFRGVDPLKDVREAAVVPPRRRDPSVPRALEAVSLKMLAARAEDRYGSARALADDLGKWLADEPVTAWREPWSIRARRWMRRHRTLVASAAAVVLVGMLALSIAYSRESAYNRKLRETNLELTDANARVTRARSEADRRLDQTLQAIEDYYTGVGAEVLLGQKEFQPLRQRLLEKPRQFYEQMARELESSPSPDDRMKHLLAKGRFGLGRISLSLGNHAEARREVERAIEVLSELGARNATETQDQKGLASCYGNLAYLQSLAGEEAAAGESFGKAITLWKALLAREPDSRAIERELARAYTNSSSAQQQFGKLGDATNSLKQAIAMLAKLSETQGEAADVKNDLAWSYERLGDVQRLRRDLPGAEGSYREAIAIGTELVAAHPDVVDYKYRLAQSHQGLGVVRRRSGDLAGAAESHRSAATNREALVASRPNVPDYQNELAGSYNNLGVVAESGGDHRAATDFYNKAINVQTKLIKSQPGVPAYQERLALSFHNLGDVYFNSEQPSKATESYRRAIEIRSRLTRDLPWNAHYSESLAFSYTNCGGAQSSAGDHAGALESLSHAIEIRSTLVSKHPNVPEYQEGLATSYTSLASEGTASGNPDSALEPARRAIGILTKLVSSFPDAVYYKSGLGVALEALGSALLGLRQYHEADQAFERAIEYQKFALERSPGVVHFRGSLSHHYAVLGESLRMQGRVDAAVRIALLRKSLWSKEPGEFYKVASELARCVPIVRKPAQLKAVAGEAIEALRLAVAVGYTDAAWMSRDTDLVPLHDRADFRALVAEPLRSDIPGRPIRAVRSLIEQRCQEPLMPSTPRI